MTEEVLAHPGFVMFVGAALVAVLRGPARTVVALAAPAVALALVLGTADGVRVAGSFAGVPVAPFAADRLSRLFGVVFALMALGGVLFGLRQPRRMELPAALFYAGAALGVAFAGDLLTVFLFWELMAVGSTLVLWSAGTPQAYRASMRYLAVHLFGGMLLLLGVAARFVETGTLGFDALVPGGAGYWLILGGFLVNAGAPPLSSWIADAYPEASWSGTVFLSAFTTKIAVYALLRGFPGEPVLIGVGLYMAFYGIVYALLENDMRRILAYSIVNQVGFMVAAVGIGTPMALNGAAAHAFTHILYKGLLLMSAGSVLYATGRRKCTDLGGLFRSMPITTVCGIVGALAISSFPLTSGFVSKSLTLQAASDEHLLGVWLALTAASAGVFLHAGIKFPWFVFFQKDSGLRPSDPPLSMRLAMILFATLCIVLGVWYEPLYRMLPFSTDYVPYTGWHVVGQLQLLLFSGLAFFVLLPLLQRTRTITLDVDWIGRRAFPAVAGALLHTWQALGSAGHASSSRLAASVLDRLRHAHGPDGMLGRTWSVRSMGLWMLAMLLSLLLIGFVA